MKEIKYMLSKLQDKLLEEEIEIDDNDLLEVVKEYDRLYGYLEEQHLTSIGKYRYQFLYTNNLTDDDETNFEIVKSLIELYRFKAFYLLDYPVLLHKFTGGMFHFNNSLNTNNKLDLLLSIYLTYLYSDYDDIEESYIRDHANTLSRIINDLFKDVMDSKYVSSNQKDIISKYNDILLKYYDISSKDNYYRDSMFDLFMDISYAYLVVNNKINDEYDKIMDFLNRVDDSVLDINHKLIVSDIETEEDLLKVIKSFYKNKKILIKKQIK